MTIDDKLSEYSFEVFWELETGQQRIIKFLAKNGPLNITELGKMNTRYTLPGFDRWGVLNRIKGSSKFLSLLDYDYLQEIQINKKETMYELTLKGLMYSLSSVPFEDNYMIKRYRKFLKTHLKKSKDIEEIIQFIKYEIAYVLRYNAVEGINWKKYTSIPGYLENQREPGKIDSFYINFHTELDPEKQYPTEIDELKKEYSNLHHWCWYNVQGSLTPMKSISSEQIFREWKKFVLNNRTFNPVYLKHIIYNLFCRMWMFAIIEPHFDENIHDLVWYYFQIRGFDLRPKLINMSKRDYEKFMENEQVREKLASMFGSIRLN